MVAERVRGGDEFEAYFLAMYPRAFGMARKILGSVDEAEDVANEAMTRVLVAWPRLRLLPHRDGWVLKVAANLSVDVLRRRRPTDVLAPLPGSDIATEVADRADVAAALAKLPGRQRTVLTLRYAADLSEQQIAQTLGISQGSVKRHASRGMQRLTKELGGRDADAGTEGDLDG